MVGRTAFFFAILVIIQPLSVSAREGTFFSPKNIKFLQRNSVDSLEIRPGCKFLAPDKAQHFMGSIMATVFLSKFSRDHLNWSRGNSKTFSAGFTLSLGILKEVRDGHQPNNHFSWKDLLADASGIIVGVILVNQ